MGAESELPRILVVDDEPVMREILEIVLTTEGWRVELVASAEEGLERCRERDFELVVLDHWLPGLTGIELARRLRDGGCATPIVIFSACVDPELAVAGRHVGARVIDKLNWKELVRVCRDVAARADAPPQFAVRHR